MMEIIVLSDDEDGCLASSQSSVANPAGVKTDVASTTPTVSPTSDSPSHRLKDPVSSSQEHPASSIAGPQKRGLKLVLVHSPTHPIQNNLQSQHHQSSTPHQTTANMTDITNLSSTCRHRHRQCCCRRLSEHSPKPSRRNSCDSCADNSDSDYDDTAYRQRPRKRARHEAAVAVVEAARPTGTGMKRPAAAKSREKEKHNQVKRDCNQSANNQSAKTSAAATAERAQVTCSGAVESQAERRAKETARLLVRSVVGNLDWEAAAVALAALQVQCQRRRWTASLGRIGWQGASDQGRDILKREVAEALKAYWTQVLSAGVSQCAFR